MGSRTCVLLLTRSLDPVVLDVFDHLGAELGPQFDCWMLLDWPYDGTPPVGNRKHFKFSQRTLQSLQYKPIVATVIPGGAHMPLFLFARESSPYEFYWLVEYDVRFTGDWRQLVTAYGESSDLVTCHLRFRNQQPDWGWWKTVSHPTRSRPNTEVRSFNPIYRLSRDAVECLDAEYRAGWSGHNEATIPTLLHANGLKLEEIGGRGPFVADSNRDRFYTPTVERKDGWLTGSMRFRPGWISADLKPGLLYHPVKPQPPATVSAEQRSAVT
jgi:Protein of unknown function (DUF3405)